MATTVEPEDVVPARSTLPAASRAVVAPRSEAPAPEGSRRERAAPGPPGPARSGAPEAGGRRVLTVVSLATFLTLMSYTAPMLTLPGMTASFGTGVSGQAWLINGMPLGLAALLLVAGSLADDFGRRRAFTAGLFGLAVTALLAALATGTLGFTLARIAHGAAGAAVIASSLGLLAHTFPAGPARIRATGIWGAALSGGIAVGPVVAAALTRLDWRLAHLLFALGALALAAAASRSLPESRSPRPGRPDLLGAALLGLSLTALLAALTVGRDGWLRPTVGGLFAASLALAAGFVHAERRVAAPLLDLALLRRPGFVVATSGALFTGLGVIGLFSYLPALLQQSLGLSELTTAWPFFVWSGTALLVALQTRRLPARFAPHHQLALGFVVSALGALTMLGAVAGDAWVRLLSGFAVAGVGSGLLNSALPRLAVESVPKERVAMGSGANNTARYIGSSMGLSLTVVVATSAPGGDRAAALAEGADSALFVAVGLMALGAVAALLFGGRRETGTES
ncbi:MFS transporter [Streptomyces sp. AJS327]|uniref:MFS transporter n=1 Tax=Streptomyces sp. AJS327 TaxID=2545265 RepID=UPI0027E3C004|nr:MFS transporter [Streptomyces sp. AJS327]